MKPLASDFDVVYRSQNPHKEYPFSPSLLVLNSGRYVMSYDISDRQGYISVSDDRGKSWQVKAQVPFFHASLFLDGDRIYLMGASVRYREQGTRDLIVMRSDDQGDTWSEDFFLTHGQRWHHCAAGVWYKDGYVYVPMDLTFQKEGEIVRSGWKPNVIAPMLLRESWVQT